MAKMYRPYLVSRNERLAYQLSDDRQIKTISFRTKKGRRNRGTQPDRFLSLGDWISPGRQPIHLFSGEMYNSVTKSK